MPQHQYEVIVVVDGSDDGTREMIATLAAPYRLDVVWQPNRGRAGACNAGIRVARGALIVLLDDDMEPAPGFLEAHERAHPAGTRVGVMGAVPIAVEPSSPPVVGYIGAKFNHHLEMLAAPGHRFTLRDFYTGNFSIDRALLLEIGAFDEDFTIYGNEDLELARRLTGAGVQLVYDAEALARQHYTKDFASLARDTVAKGRTAVLLAAKHPDAVRELKLGAPGSRRARLVRAVLLGLTSVWRRMPEAVVGFMCWLGPRRPRRMDRAYAVALDYFYWLGARAAQRELPRVGQPGSGRARPAAEP